HLFQQALIESGPRRRICRHRAADVRGPEDLREHVVAAAHVGRLGREYVLQQAATPELPEQATESFESRGLCLRLFLESAENRRGERLGASSSVRFADSEFPRHRLKSTCLSKDVG